MNRTELLQEMENAMDRYDLTEKIKESHIGEWTYGVAMVPCDWVYKYVKAIDKLEQVRLSESLRMYVDEILDELYDSD